eukprot:5087298-Pyramimonas_sp.AAC.1
MSARPRGPPAERRAPRSPGEGASRSRGPYPISHTAKIAIQASLASHPGPYPAIEVALLSSPDQAAPKPPRRRVIFKSATPKLGIGASPEMA